MKSVRENIRMNKYEVILLLDGTIKIYLGEERDKIIEELSEAFQKEAINSQKNRTTSYRSKKGISSQLKKMERMFFYEDKIDKTQSWNRSKLYDEIIELYNTNHKAYFDLLKKAKERYNL